MAKFRSFLFCPCFFRERCWRWIVSLLLRGGMFLFKFSSGSFKLLLAFLLCYTTQCGDCPNLAHVLERRRACIAMPWLYECVDCPGCLEMLPRTEKMETGWCLGSCGQSLSIYIHMAMSRGIRPAFFHTCVATEIHLPLWPMVHLCKQLFILESQGNLFLGLSSDLCRAPAMIYLLPHSLYPSWYFLLRFHFHFPPFTF